MPSGRATVESVTQGLDELQQRLPSAHERGERGMRATDLAQKQIAAEALKVEPNANLYFNPTMTIYSCCGRCHHVHKLVGLA